MGETLSQNEMDRRVRMTMLRSFTIEPVVPLLHAQLLARGVGAEINVAGFAQFEQYINAEPNRERDQTDLLVLAARLEELAPDLAYRCLSLNIDIVEAAIHAVCERVEGWIQDFRSHSAAKILLHNFAEPKHLALSIFDAQSGRGQRQIIARINSELARLVQSHKDVYLLDYDRLQRQIGTSRFDDERLWYLARQPLSQTGLRALAELYARFVCAMFSPRKKCLVLDLDNTLWGGILGEDGSHAIHLGPEYPGNAFLDFQRAILNLHDRGIILAIASKNNAPEAFEVLAQHPHMLLRPEHFAAIKANWNAKTQNLREIAAELNIGLDSLVFLDDSAHECELVRQALPEVTTIQLPADPVQYVETLANIWEFDALSFSAEDRGRGEDYQAQLERKKLQRDSSTLEDFFRSLQMEVAVLAADDSTIPRIAQLTQKTNQFNLTTKRYSENEVWQVTQNSACEICCIRVKDRFGDSGIVGVGLMRLANEQAYIDTFLLSCRVIGRHVEDVLLHHLVERAKNKAVRAVIGEYIPTAKNGQVENFYEHFGFVKQTEAGNRNLWTASLSDLQIRVSDWIKIIS